MTRELPSWISAACSRLLQLRVADVGWGYGCRGPAYTEPTAISALALLACAAADRSELAVVSHKSGDWLVTLQQPDGAIGVAADMPTPDWPTSMVALLWSQDDRYQYALTQSLRWLQQRVGHTFTKNRHCGLEHNTSIPGWPWMAGTHPWLEPTAFAMLALCRNQLGGHQRVRDGVRMVLDRANPGGGWSEGGSDSLAAGPSPHADARLTGIVLLALKAAGHHETPTVTRACQYLLEALPSVRSPETLGWGVLGLLAWRSKPAATDVWLQQSYAVAAGVHTAPTTLALLILAASDATLPMLGLARVAETQSTISGPGAMLV